MLKTETEQELVDSFKATTKKKRDLLKLCEAFIAEQQISCADCIYQSDRVIENAYKFIADVCDIVGYHEEE